MKITNEEVRHIAQLSRLEFNDEDTSLLRGQLNSILDYIDKLNEINTEGIEPTSHILALNNKMREDIPSTSLNPDEALHNAPDRSGVFLRVPKIIG